MSQTDTASRQKKQARQMFMGRRICPMCNKEFVPASNSQVACSRECAMKRKNALQRLCRTDMRPMDIDWLNAMYEETLARLDSRKPDKDTAWTVMSFVEGAGEQDSLQREMASLRAELAALKKKAAMDMEQAANALEEVKRKHRLEIEEYKNKIRAASGKDAAAVGMKECGRMKLRAYELPCGKRAKCFNPKRCASVPKGMSEKDVIRIKESWDA